MKMAENDEMIFGNRNDEVGEKMRTELMKSIMKRRITRWTIRFVRLVDINSKKTCNSQRSSKTAAKNSALL